MSSFSTGMYRKTTPLLLLLIIILCSSLFSRGFSLGVNYGGTMIQSKTFHASKNRMPNPLSSTFTDANHDSPSNVLPDPSSMSIKEIKEELKGLGVSFADCFDKDSLIERIRDARCGKTLPKPNRDQVDSTGTSHTNTSSNMNTQFHREEVAADLRTKTVRQLRTLCAQNNIRWANLIEKEELVQALVQYQQEALKFSPSGKIMPGKVAVIDDDILTKELAAGAATTPLLLDVYATWCGPCKMMSPFLEEAAQELGDKVRMAKIDSDQYPEWSSKLNVRSLPTIIVFDGKTGKEIERVEGALMKDQLVRLASKYVA